MLKSLSIYPPLAFARVGSGEEPCSAFSWSRAEIAPDTPAVTSLQPEETLNMDADGTITSSIPNDIALKDDEGRFLPVCPFFELWGTWERDGSEVDGPITQAVLDELDLKLSDVQWTVELANLKAYHVTLKDGDRVEAREDANQTQTGRIPLSGRSPSVGQPLVDHADGIPLGAFQLSKPDSDFPELRLRFYPPAGTIYGPSGFSERLEALIASLASRPSLARANARWRALNLPADRQRVHPNSTWANHNFRLTPVPPIGRGDNRLNPSGLVASLLLDVVAGPSGNEPVFESIGLIDDVSDGVITCELGGRIAKARVSVGPPDFAPANRPIVSIQDGLSDREIRDEARGDAIPDEELEAIVADIFERALETSDLMNKDAQNARARASNSVSLPNPGPGFETDPLATLWPEFVVGDGTPTTAVEPQSVDAMPVTMLGQRKHRRYNALEYVRDRLREEPDLIERWIRPPRAPVPFYDRRMPALMRGSDRNPMHLTRRQYEMLQIWAKRQRDALVG